MSIAVLPSHDDRRSLVLRFVLRLLNEKSDVDLRRLANDERTEDDELS